MRNLLVILLLSMTFVSQVGYYGIFAIQQTVVRYEQKKKMLSQIPDAELDQIPYHRDMELLDDGTEFSLHGELYDIVRTKKINGRVIYLALNDKKESRLLKKLADAGQDQSQTSAGKKGTLKLQLVYCERLLLTVAENIIPLRVQNPVLPHLKGTNYIRVSVPPPDQILS